MSTTNAEYAQLEAAMIDLVLHVIVKAVMLTMQIGGRYAEISQRNELCNSYN